MPLIGVLLSRYWKPLALAIAIAAVLAYRAVLVRERDQARAQAAQLTIDAAALRAGNQALGAAIARQNAAVAELKTKADAAASAMNAQAAAAASAGVAAADRAANQAQGFIAAPIDSGSGCEGAIKWGNAQAAQLASW